jgi:predicted cupin superfamily sugar epimerase
VTVEEIIKLLDLKPHPEGGFYKETYKSSDLVPDEQLPDRYTLVTGPPSGKSFTRESMEWQVPPDADKKNTAAISPRPGQSAKSEEKPVAQPQSESGRVWSTSIYYLLTPDTFSAMHKLKGDEVYHFYLGDPVEMLNLYPNSQWKTVKLGHDIANGATVQHVVPHGVWQGSRLIEGGKFALMGTTMAPGFSFKDCSFGSRKALSDEWVACASLIEKLTRE